MSVYIGTVAGSLTTISFLPQVIKLLKTKSVHDISIITFTILLIGVLLWIVYGFMINNINLIIFNFILMFLVSIIIITYFLYR